MSKAQQITVTIGMRFWVLPLVRVVVFFAKCAALFTHPCDFVARENIENNTANAILKIVDKGFFVKC